MAQDLEHLSLDLSEKYDAMNKHQDIYLYVLDSYTLPDVTDYK